MDKTPDLYEDPARKLEYAEYMSKLAPNDTSPKQRKYFQEQVKMYRASREGHADMTAKTRKAIDEKTQAARGRARKAIERTAQDAKSTRGPKYAKGGSVSSASKRADGCVTKGKTRGKMV